MFIRHRSRDPPFDFPEAINSQQNQNNKFYLYVIINGEQNGTYE
jgi:hypothetical protein